MILLHPKLYSKKTLQLRLLPRHSELYATLPKPPELPFHSRFIIRNSELCPTILLYSAFEANPHIHA